MFPGPVNPSSTSSSSSSPKPLSSTSTTPPTNFEEVLASQPSLPEPGPSYFEARRALWLTRPPALPPRPPSSTPLLSLEEILRRPGALQSDEVWDGGLAKISKNLLGGGRTRRPLPVQVVLKILYAGWVRDGTWPEGMIPADESDFFDPDRNYPLPTPESTLTESFIPVGQALASPPAESSAMATRSQVEESQL
ncbi:hypothetical protein EWM64_g9377 [Hericium alpestre]|uniref:DUF4050 domain-containing protein n=1 Tax=Hericium alpestre TaxID=135208 RepID=A0A4Y9ZJK9_9AGAM|nr:hypothetical protein EWM64_g9377 [Hericium alpestre]